MPGACPGTLRQIGFDLGRNEIVALRGRYAMVQGWATLAIAIPVLVSAAVDYSFPDLDPYCAKFADMTTCTTGEPGQTCTIRFVR